MVGLSKSSMAKPGAFWIACVVASVLWSVELSTSRAAFGCRADLAAKEGTESAESFQVTAVGVGWLPFAREVRRWSDGGRKSLEGGLEEDML